jgi:O-antigen ligase
MTFHSKRVAISKPASVQAGRARATLRTAWVRWSPGLVSFAVLLVDGLAGGGYFPRTWRLTTFAFCALAAAALVGRPRIALSGLERAFLALLAGLAGWTTLSTVWSDTPGTSVLEGERTAVYVAGAALALLAVERATVTVLLAGGLAGVTAASAYGLGTYVIFGHELNPIEGNLLFEPLGYANGLGIYAAIGILLAVGLGLAAERWVARAPCLACLVVLVPTLYLTHSRAAELGVVCGLATLLAFGRRAPRAVTVALALAATAAVVAVAVASGGERGVASRLAGQNRPHYWHVAWREYEQNAALGSGAGTFDRYWLRYRPVSSFARDAHSVYLETLAELGPVGLGLLLGALFVPLLALRPGSRDPVLATAAAGYVAFLVHAGVDWDWELPAVTLAGLLCGAAMLVAGRTPGTPELSSRGRLALLVPALALAVLALARLEIGPRLPF